MADAATTIASTIMSPAVGSSSMRSRTVVRSFSAAT
jgi:hypothetical protein